MLPSPENYSNAFASTRIFVDFGTGLPVTELGRSFDLPLLRRDWSVLELDYRDKYEKTALSDGSIGFVPYGDIWYFCLTQGVNLTFGQGTRSGYLPAESGSL